MNKNRNYIHLCLIFFFVFLISGCNPQPFSECGGGVLAYSDFSNIYLSDTQLINQRDYEFKDNYITSGSFSDDGKSLLYSDMRNPGLFQLNLDNGQKQVLLLQNLESFPSYPKWSDDGLRIVFADGGADNDSLTYILDTSKPTSGNQLNIDFLGSEKPLAWLDNYKILLMDQIRTPLSYQERKLIGGEWKKTTNLVVLDLRTNHKEIIYTTNKLISDGALDIGKNRIAFIEGDPGIVFLLKLRGKELEKINTIPKGSSRVIWSPNSNCLLYENKGSLYIYSFKTKNNFEFMKSSSGKRYIPLDWKNLSIFKQGSN